MCLDHTPIEQAQLQPLCLLKSVCFKMLMLLLLICCTGAIFPIIASSDCVVTFPEKSVGVGVRNVSFSKVGYCQYFGVRYATAKRFQAPVLSPPKYNEQYLKAGHVCPQLNDLNYATAVLGDEDCLFMNVFAPEVRGRKLLPVLVFIHGGSFIVGSSTFDIDGVDLLIENKVIVVSINYRLDVLGFLHYPKFNITGNNGLKDQQTALKWINRYIESFGGDPNRVTLMGQSAGAASVNYHLYSDRSRGLFQQAALLSGSFLAPWAYTYRPEYSAEKFFHHLGITSREQLLARSYRDLFFLRGTTPALDFEFFNMATQGFIPTSETDDDPGAFVTASPQELIIRKASLNVPLLVGITLNEVELFLPANKDIYSDGANVPNRWKRDVWSLVKNFSETELRKFKENGIVSNRTEFIQNVSNHIYMNFPIQYYIDQIISKGHSTPIYAYRFAFDGKFGKYKNVYSKDEFKVSRYGAVHGDDLSYIFTPYNLEEAKKNKNNFQKELDVYRKFSRMISNFVKRGNPSVKNFQWNTYDMQPDRTQYVLIEHVPELKTGSLLEPHYYNLCKAIYDCLYYFNCSSMQNTLAQPGV